MLEIEIIPCLRDNYAYLLLDTSGNSVGVVDPSESVPVNAALMARNLALTHIFNTHHHWDHTGGNLDLKSRWGARIIGPGKDRARIPGLDEGVSEGDVYEFGACKARVLEIPGHTRGHIAFYFPESRALFCGDTLFSLGCGRLFEGTPAQMWDSLGKLRRLPAETKVYCGHEYTATNARFALSIDPDNAALQIRAREVAALRAKNLPTVPSTMESEIAANPFLRADDPALARALKMEAADPVAVFAEVRRRKDGFRG